MFFTRRESLTSTHLSANISIGSRIGTWTGLFKFGREAAGGRDRSLRTAALPFVSGRHDATRSGSTYLHHEKAIIGALGAIGSASIVLLAAVLAVWLSAGHPTCVSPTTLPWLSCGDQQ
jgi:hypothetical protein